MSQHSSPLCILGEITRNSFRPEPSFQPKTISIGYIVTQALVTFFVIWYAVSPTAALHKVTPAGSTTMNILFIGLALFAGKSG
jgi:hypothetical protein